MLNRRAHRELTAILGQRDLRTALAAYLKRQTPKAKRSSKLHAQRQASKRAEHARKTAEIREACISRSEGFCELCSPEAPTTGSEMHHLEGGSGRRREMQAVENCVWVCRDCHLGYHRWPAAYREAVLKWAEKHGYPVPSRFRGADTHNGEQG